MEIKTKIIYTETIKPTSPTPKSLQKHQLSFLDQLLHTSFMPFLYFYTSNPKIPNSQKSNHLKNSLSEVLPLFYPLAGRLVGNAYVHCNDGGVPFSEAEADCDLSQVITDTNPKNMHKFLPFQLINESQDLCMAVQATYFRCGGLAVGLLISHEIGDALSLIFFANTWSAVARKGDCGGVPLPKFDAAAYFPPRDISRFKHSAAMFKEELTARTVIFPASKISLLRERYRAGGEDRRRPTRVEALSAFIWTRFISATGMKADPVHKTCVVRHAINLRNRVEPPLSEYLFGNVLGVSTATPAVEDGGADVVQKFREAMKAVSGGSSGYVARLQGGDEKQLDVVKDSVERTAGADKGELVNFLFTSLCGFPLYEADFGWGEPVLVRTVGFSYMNLVIFVDTKSGGGIEALICLKKSDMEKFEAELELPLLNSNM